jgi:2-phosphosulfolactate phosphatase
VPVKRLDIATTPAEALLLPAADCFIVIDVLRATTTMAVLFERGLESLLVVEELEAAVAARAGRDALLFGERGGLRPEGFDYGNSPSEAATLDVTGRHAIQVTSNGTRALCSVAGRGTAATGSLVNLSATARFAAAFETVMAVCAGNGGAARFSLEDFATAAALVQLLHAAHPEAALGDAARLALALPSPDSLVPASEHADVVRALGFADDIALATRRDLVNAVPVVREHGAGWCRLERA